MIAFVIYWRAGRSSMMSPVLRMALAHCWKAGRGNVHDPCA
jgi:hypothetical protein